MPIGTAAAIGLTAAGVGSSIAGSAISAHAAGKAADAQVAAANHAADLQHQDAQAALALQQQQYNNAGALLTPGYDIGLGAEVNLANQLGTLPQSSLGQPLPQFQPAGSAPGAAGTAAPPSSYTIPPAQGAGAPSANYQHYLANDRGPFGQAADNRALPLTVNRTGGAGAPAFGSTAAKGPTLGSLINPSLGASGSLNAAYPGGAFVAPTGVTEQNDPGYQFRVDEGKKAIDRSAAARGGLVTGGTAKALDQYAQGLASDEYQNVYNRAANTYGINYDTFENQQANEYNRLAALAGGQQVGANNLSLTGQNFANSSGQILQNDAQNQGQQINNAGQARASGYLNQGQAWGSLPGDIFGGVSSLGKLFGWWGGK